MPAPPDQHAEIGRAVELLRAGGVVAFPTETVYGLGADAFNERAVRRVFELKGRPEQKALTLHVADVGAARACVRAWTPRAEALAKKFWPGPLTIILPRSPRVPDVATGGGDTVGLRCPDHPLTLELLRAFGGPLVGPSANLSGEPPPTTADEVRRVFDERDVLVLDGGPCREGVASTVLDISDPRGDERILRQGCLTGADLGVRE